ncbi:MAG TPA: type IV pilus assembly protein PilM [Verrucomicrobiota bacterium]|nr:type IV pilus assembly protein PilM [Verrucomicrobiota bacterium]
MLKSSKSFLAVDFGVGTLKVAEFSPSEDGGLRLLRFGLKPLGLAGSQEAAREGVVKKALTELLAEGGFTSTAVNLCAPGFEVFSKFVKLPPVDTSKVTQIIQYEAQQNVPFPLAEAAWDYQILGTSSNGELEVLLVAIKSEVVEKQVFGAGEAAGLKMQTVDASIGALANAFRYNYADQDGCNLLIDIGAKTSNVLLFEPNKYYSRRVNVGANAITQEFAAEAKMRFDEAEKFKIGDGFVSLGGAYEEPDNPRIAAVSKVARNVLTRLHLQVNQTIQFYRTQQGGAAPVRVFLCGGGALMPYATQFFEEKLSLPVEFFNPFRNVQIDPSVDVSKLEPVAPQLGEVVGLGLRNVAQCPIELNLMPKASLTRQQFNAKKPFLLAAAYAAVLGVFAVGWFFSRVTEVRREGLTKIEGQLQPLASTKSQLDAAQARLKKVVDESSQVGRWIEDRLYWAQILQRLGGVLLSTEKETRAKLGAPVGIWIDTLLSTEPSKDLAQEEENAEPSSRGGFMMDPVLARRYGLIPQRPVGEGAENAAEGTAEGGRPKAKAPANSTNEIAVVNLTIRAVNLNAKANSEIAYALEKAMKACELFDEKDTQLAGNLEQVSESAVSFSFPLKVKLKRPIKL